MFIEKRGEYLAENELPEGFELVANPLGGDNHADRERRVYQRKSGNAVTYGSFVIKLARNRTFVNRELAIIVQHGGGHEIATLATGPDSAAMESALLAMDERTLYATLFSIARAMRDAHERAQRFTAQDWRSAAAEKRIRRRSYPKRGTVKVWIEPARLEGESDANFELRKRCAVPA